MKKIRKKHHQSYVPQFNSNNPSLKKIDITRKVAEYLVGGEYKTWHRWAIGVFIIIVGTIISDLLPMICQHEDTLKIGIKAAGGTVHAIGAIPFVEYVMDRKKIKSEASTEKRPTFLKFKKKSKDERSGNRRDCLG